MAMIAEMALFPWENVDMAVRERAEQEIWSDVEYQQWLDELLADSGWLEADSQQPADMSELAFMAHMADQLEARTVEKTLILTDEMLSEIEGERIGFDFCRQPFLY